MKKIIDLTQRLEHGMRGVEFDTKYTVEHDGWNARTLHLYSHCGTHMDSALHFNAGPQTIDDIELADCVGRAWLVELDDISPRTPIMVSHLDARANDIEPGDAVLLRTLWSRQAGDPQHYRDNFPPISSELAEWLVARQVRMVGVESPSVADVNNLDELTEVHNILLHGQVIIVEGLTNLDQLQGPSCLFGAFPLKIADGDGAPCRAFAVDGEPDKEWSALLPN